MTTTEDTDTGGGLDLREVSQVHVRWVEKEPDQPGEFVLSVVLDDGAFELVATPPAQVLEVALPLLGTARSVFVDLNAGQVLIGRLAIDVQRA